LLVYVSSWLKCYYPDVFAAALLNSMPMGFYQPAQVVIDARNHDVEVRSIDVNHSNWDNTLEERSGKYLALRLGFRQIKGIREEDMLALVQGRTHKYTSLTELRHAGVSQAALERLADADAFRSLGMDRRKALWEVSSLQDMPIGLFEGQNQQHDIEGQISLPFMSTAEHVVQDYAATALSLKAHPLSFAREQLRALNIKSSKELSALRDGALVKVGGLVLVRQRPGTAGGVCFITIEDETGFSNLVIFQGLFEKYRKEILGAKLLMVEGKLQREGAVTHVVVRQCFDLTRLLHLNKSQEVDKPSPAEHGERNTFPAKNKRTQIRHSGQEELDPFYLPSPCCNTFTVTINCPTCRMVCSAP
jgi:error-prone DNA polymerase